MRGDSMRKSVTSGLHATRPSFATNFGAACITLANFRSEDTSSYLWVTEWF